MLLLTGAALGDRFGRARMFVAGLVLFVAASVGCALAGSAGWLIAAAPSRGRGRAHHADCDGATERNISARNAPRSARDLSGVTGFALIVGPVLGGAIAQGAAWRGSSGSTSIGLIVIPLAYRRIPESFGAGTAIDGTGVALVTGTALGLVFGLMQGNVAGWGSGEVLTVLGAGLLLAACFVVWERRARSPMVPMPLFRSRAFSSGVSACFLYSAGMYGVLFFLPQFLQTAQGYGPLGAGLRLLPWTAMLFVVAPVAGTLVNRIGERPLIVVGLVLQAIGMSWIALIAAPDLAFSKLIAPLILSGAGVSMAMPAAQNAVLSSVARTEVGKASGIFNMFRFLGGVTGIAIAVAVFAATGGFGSANAFTAGFVAATGVSAILSLLGAVAGLWQPARLAVGTESVSAKA